VTTRRQFLGALITGVCGAIAAPVIAVAAPIMREREQIFRGEIGRYHNIRFFSQRNEPFFPGHIAQTLDGKPHYAALNSRWAQ